MCIRIFNSDCRSLCSTSSAPSVFNTKIYLPICTSYESSFENGLCVCIITFEIPLHAHLRNVLKYDYLIMKTKEIISFIWLWKRLLLLNSLCNEETFFLHWIFQTMAIFTFANALVWLSSPTWNVTTRNDFWFHFARVPSEWLANFQSGPTFSARRGKSLEAPPQCLWIADQGVKTL